MKIGSRLAGRRIVKLEGSFGNEDLPERLNKLDECRWWFWSTARGRWKRRLLLLLIAEASYKHERTQLRHKLGRHGLHGIDDFVRG